MYKCITCGTMQYNGWKITASLSLSSILLQKSLFLPRLVLTFTRWGKVPCSPQMENLFRIALGSCHLLVLASSWSKVEKTLLLLPWSWIYCFFSLVFFSLPSLGMYWTYCTIYMLINGRSTSSIYCKACSSTGIRQRMESHSLTCQNRIFWILL